MVADIQALFLIAHQHKGAFRAPGQLSRVIHAPVTHLVGKMRQQALFSSICSKRRSSGKRLRTLRRSTAPRQGYSTLSTV